MSAAHLRLVEPPEAEDRLDAAIDRASKGEAFCAIVAGARAAIEHHHQRHLADHARAMQRLSELEQGAVTGLVPRWASDWADDFDGPSSGMGPHQYAQLDLHDFHYSLGYDLARGYPRPLSKLANECVELTVPAADAWNKATAAALGVELPDGGESNDE